MYQWLGSGPGLQILFNASCTVLPWHTHILLRSRKLHEVRDRLDQLKDLAQYYQGGSEIDSGTDGATYVMEQLSRRAEGDKRENRRLVCVGQLLNNCVHVRVGRVRTGPG